MSENDDTKIKTTVRYTQKRGNHLAVLDGLSDHLIAYAGETERHIEPNLPDPKRKKVESALEKFEALIELQQHTGRIRKESFYFPESLVLETEQAAEIAKQQGLEFKPTLAIIKALKHEISKILNKTSSKSFDPLEARKIFENLFEQKGFLTVFQRLLAERYHKPIKDDEIQLQYLHNYYHGKAKPSLWVYACALETLNALKVDIFNIGVSLNTLCELWYAAHKEALTKDQIVNEFRETFGANDQAINALKKVISSKQKNL